MRGSDGMVRVSLKTRSPWVGENVPVNISRRAGMHDGVVLYALEKQTPLAMSWSSPGV